MAPLLAVNVYVVVDDGVTTVCPFNATFPIPWSMLTDVAPEISQLIIAEAPNSIAGGSAMKELTTTCCVVGVISIFGGAVSVGLLSSGFEDCDGTIVIQAKTGMVSKASNKLRKIRTMMQSLKLIVDIG